MTVRPLQDRVLVKRHEVEEKPEGIILVTKKEEKPLEGVVLACGKGKLLPDGTLVPLEVKEGDLVMFGKFAGTEVKLGDDDCLILKEEDILCVIE